MGLLMWAGGWVEERKTDCDLQRRRVDPHFNAKRVNGQGQDLNGQGVATSRSTEHLMICALR